MLCILLPIIVYSRSTNFPFKSKFNINEFIEKFYFKKYQIPQKPIKLEDNGDNNGGGDGDYDGGDDGGNNGGNDGGNNGGKEEEEDVKPLIDEDHPIVKYVFLGLFVFVLIVLLGALASLIALIAVLISTLVKKVKYGDY